MDDAIISLDHRYYIMQALAYQACDHACVSPHIPKAVDT